jgi:hypothetical protein
LLVGAGGATLHGAGNHAGINVQSGGTVIIDKVEGETDAECCLTVNGGDDGAAIGGNPNSSCGNIVINGGTVTATGGDEAAAIGGGNIHSAGNYTIGTITINGGIVTANGRDRGAGIGTGVVQFTSSANLTAEGIYINGGVVNASDTNDGRGAGIGTGEVAEGSATINEIVISGGVVTASVCNDEESGLVPQEAAGAGIGTGMTEVGGHATISRIAITGGTVDATGACRGAGIGTGGLHQGFTTASAKATVGSIEISGGQVTATGGSEAAGIGTGVAHGNNMQSEVSSIAISGGTVTATKGANAHGSDIGNATSNKGNSTGTTTMDSVTVTGGSFAAGTTLTNPTNGVKSNLHALTVPGSWTPGEKVEIVGLPDGYGTNDIFADENGEVHVIVPDGYYVFNANGRLFEGTVSGGPATARYAEPTGMTIGGVDIAYGSGPDWFYDGKTLSVETNATETVSGESRLPVKILLDDGADITLDDVRIVSTNGAPAVATTAGANVTLRLDGDNVLEGGTGSAAVQPAATSTITICDGAEDGIGTLTADGGSDAAAIGAGASEACGNVTIEGGHIIAYGGTDAAGIGAGANPGADCGTITVAGGTVEAEHTGHHSGSTGQDVGNGVGGECAGIVVTGGSLVADHGMVSPQPSGLADVVHAVTIQDDDWSTGQSIDITGLPSAYGTNDIVVAEQNGHDIVRVYLPDGGYPFQVNDVWYVATVDGADTNAVRAALGGDTWLDGSSPLWITASGQDSESDANMLVSFKVQLKNGFDFQSWVDLSLANGKLGVVIADGMAAIDNADLATLADGGSSGGARLAYVGTAACSESAAEYVSCDAESKTVTIRMPIPSPAAPNARLYRVCIFN